MISSDGPHYFEGVLQGDKIYERQYGKDSQQIGVSLAKYDQLESEHNALIDSYNEYQEILLKHGLIEVPLSPDEKIKKLIEVNERQAAHIEELTKHLEKFLEVGNEHSKPAESGGAVESNDKGSRKRNRSNSKKHRKVG